MQRNRKQIDVYLIYDRVINAPKLSQSQRLTNHITELIGHENSIKNVSNSNFWGQQCITTWGICLEQLTHPPRHTLTHVCAANVIWNKTNLVSQHFIFFCLFLLNLLQYCFCFMFWCLFWPRGMWDHSSPTRDLTHTPCTGKRSLNHWNTREVPSSSTL